MRKLLVVLFILPVGLKVKAQSWVDIGLKGSIGLDMLYNKNINDDPEFNQQLSMGYNVGGKLGFNFDDFHEVTLDVLYYNFNQKYKYNVLDPVDNSSPQFNRSITFSGLDFLLMYRHNNDGRYVEIGPQLSLVKKVNGTDDHPLSTFSDADFKAHVAPTFTSVVFGFGSYLLGTENFGITTGIRLSYSFSDFLSQDGKDAAFPANSSVYPETPGSTPVLVNRTYPSYSATHLLTAMFVMEFNFDFAYMAKAKCSNKRKLVLF